MADISKTEYKHLAQYLASGVTIVTSRSGNDINGMVATSLCSVSLEPPLFLVCVDKKWTTHQFVNDSKVFTINFLSEDQKKLSEVFGSPNPEKNEMLGGISSPSPNNGCAVIDGCIGSLDCEAVAVYDASDHSIFLGKVLGGEIKEEGKPLIHFTGNYYTIS